MPPRHGYCSQVQTASIATAKNELSRLLRLVKRGQSVIITERNQPVARLQPLGSETRATPDAVSALHAAGVLAPPTGGRLDVGAFRAAPRPRLTASRSLTQAVLADREDGR